MTTNQVVSHCIDDWVNLAVSPQKTTTHRLSVARYALKITEDEGKQSPVILIGIWHDCSNHPIHSYVSLSLVCTERVYVDIVGSIRHYGFIEDIMAKVSL